MVDGGKVFGYFLLGQIPRSARRTAGCNACGMANLDWLVVRDLAMIESATFWKDAPEIETGEIVTEKCRYRGLLLPAASHVEGRHLHTDATHAPVARPGRRTVR
ncbi:hypothetical protein E4K10_29770 [Streptomyces sp. T1317-0309]|nr:hypothetical protein E4K10_29770 [Streptomyces sp. T1317-0309]